MSASAIVGIISAILGIARFFTNLAEQKRWINAGAASATLKGIDDADISIKAANKARADMHDINTRDPAGVLRDDDGFKRPD